MKYEPVDESVLKQLAELGVTSVCVAFEAQFQQQFFELPEYRREGELSVGSSQETALRPFDTPLLGAVASLVNTSAVRLAMGTDVSGYVALSTTGDLMECHFEVEGDEDVPFRYKGPVMLVDRLWEVDSRGYAQPVKAAA